jgi:ribose transport system substrate-binding protein
VRIKISSDSDSRHGMAVPTWGRIAIASAVVIAIVALSACGGGGSSSGGSSSTSGSGPELASGGSSSAVVKEAEQLVAEGSKPVTEFPGPYKGPVAEAGKKILYVSCNDAAEGCKRTELGVEEAAAAAGWQLTKMDSLGNPATASDMIGRAKALGVEGVVVAALPPAAVQQGLEEAHDAGIFVVGAEGNTKPEGFDASAVWNYKHMGELEGAWMIEHSAGEAQVVRFNDPTFEAVSEDGAGLEAELSKCPGCEVVKTVETSVATIATKAESQCSSTFTGLSGPLYYVSGGYDALVNPFCVNGARSAGVSPEKLVMASWSGNKLNLKEVSEGDGYQQADVASPGEWSGWEAVDQLNRLFHGEKPYPQPSIPVRLLTKESITPEMLKSGWQGDVDFRQKFTELFETGETSK